MEADSLCEHIEVGKTDRNSPHLMVPLLGGFKGEDEDRMCILPIAKETCSGNHICLWVK